MDSLLTTDACTLPTTDRPLRLAEFDDLFETSVHQAEFAGDLVRLQLTGEVGLEARVRDLAERESACCSFFTFELTGDDEHLTLDISVLPQHRDLLDDLAARARRLSA
ncbi:hypothetical protein [Knoellia subterranea]|uniref:Arsenate reductase n=1 Tax=Knoellia subterranea KCTC 19937 TaxID=1385521 RepID=A0A0A0JK10_9MICO|nr:hypothetical protein [Knoellia subterranea]KGN37760.1 hypothetical protein N803_11930 [Knoellia subterranea KCTC 19937]